MNDLSTATASTASYLKERAAYYRVLAESALSAGMARELTMMADEYEEDAGRLARTIRREIRKSDSLPKPDRSRRRP
ncbi:MAG TPA: hypothetical protein VGB82_10605 [Alphaproteobacteria bacterium]